MKISQLDSYKICFCFLEKLWINNKVTYRDHLPSLLGCLRLLSNGKSADPAMMIDWYEIVGVEELTPEDGYESLKEFLQTGTGDFYNNPETQIIVEKMDSEHALMWRLWQECVADL